MLSKVLLVLPVAVAGVAAQGPDCISEEVCVDGVNECDIPWGGCYDVCDPDAAPSPPPCPETTAVPSLPTASLPEDNCSTRTVCWDGINDCGRMYGGCFADCKPWPTFEPPPCPPSSTWETVTTTASARPECEEEGEHIICVDKVNECGKKYGGCYDYCETPAAEFEIPPCIPEATPTEAAGPTQTNGGEEPTETDEGGFPIDETCEAEGTLILCVDGIDDCGNGWGECYDICATPSLERPTTPCSPTTGPTTPS